MKWEKKGFRSPLISMDFVSHLHRRHQWSPVYVPGRRRICISRVPWKEGGHSWTLSMQKKEMKFYMLQDLQKGGRISTKKGIVTSPWMISDVKKVRYFERLWLDHGRGGLGYWGRTEDIYKDSSRRVRGVGYGDDMCLWSRALKENASVPRWFNPELTNVCVIRKIESSMDTARWWVTRGSKQNILARDSIVGQGFWAVIHWSRYTSVQVWGTVCCPWWWTSVVPTPSPSFYPDDPSPRVTEVFFLFRPRCQRYVARYQ